MSLVSCCFPFCASAVEQCPCVENSRQGHRCLLEERSNSVQVLHGIAVGFGRTKMEASHYREHGYSFAFVGDGVPSEYNQGTIRRKHQHLPVFSCCSDGSQSEEGASHCTLVIYIHLDNLMEE